MATYYKRIQTVISFGEEDLYHFVESQNMKNSLYIKKLIREEMLRQAGKGAVLPTSAPAKQETPANVPPVQKSEPTPVEPKVAEPRLVIEPKVIKPIPITPKVVAPPNKEVEQQEDNELPVADDGEPQKLKPIDVGGGTLY